MGTYSPAFINAVNFVLSPAIEGAGVLSKEPRDPGNWTGGAQGKGALLGTKWGISAKSYPSLDIGSLTREQAVAIYSRDYWAVIKGDQLPARTAFVVFDSAVNQGVQTAARILQTALSITVDGVIGIETVAAARTRDDRASVAAFLTARAVRYAQDAGFKTFGKDWIGRCFAAYGAACS